MDWKTRIKRRALLLYIRTIHEKATPEFIARGWAIGMFFGCLIPFGLQLCLSVPVALWLRGSKTGAILGTFISNPFTIVVLYPVQCFVGLRCMGGDHTYTAIEKALEHVIEDRNWQALSSIGWELGVAFFIGGAILTLIMTPLTYYGLCALITHQRAHRARRLADGRSKG